MLKLNVERMALRNGQRYAGRESTLITMYRPSNDLEATASGCLDSSLIKVTKSEVDTKSSETFLSLFPKGVLAGMSKERLSLMPKEFHEIFLQVEKGEPIWN